MVANNKRYKTVKDKREISVRVEDKIYTTVNSKLGKSPTAGCDPLHYRGRIHLCCLCCIGDNLAVQSLH